MARKETTAATETESDVVESPATDDTNSVSSIRDQYNALAAPFDVTFKRVVAGKELTYVSGEQVIRRINEILGPDAWDWEVEHDDTGINEDEARVMGKLTIRFTENVYGGSTKVGFGGAKIKRFTSGNNAGKPISIANDFKAADTDAFKKAAAKFGVGLYLYERDPEAELPESTSALRSYSGAPAPQGNRPTVAFASSGGTSETGEIQQISAKGIRLNDKWYNVSNFYPVDLAQYQVGMVVSIKHKPDKTFIDGITVLGGSVVPQEDEPDSSF